MSKWQLKGFVQDSDDEEEDLEITPPHSNRESQHALDERANETRSNTEYTRDDGEGNNGNEMLIEDTKDGEDRNTSPANTPKGAILIGPTVSPITPFVEYAPLAQPTTPPLDFSHEYSQHATESPDPLQVPLSPQVRRSEKLPSSSLSLGVPVSHQSAATSYVHDTESQPTTHGFLQELGFGPLSDASDSDVLSDPPSDMDEPIIPTTTFASPRHRTAVQVVIPRSTATQQELVQRQVARSFRERKPIQLHPYALEGELYRRELQGRGIKPVTRQRSPARNSTHHDAETQEQEFNPNGNMLYSSPPEIPVSTPVIQKGHKNSLRRIHSSSGRQRPVASSYHITPGFKRRKLDRSLTQAGVPLRRPVESPKRPDSDIWRIPQSPPHSSSPPAKSVNLAPRRSISPVITTAVPELPTPSQSSSLQGDPQSRADSDLEPVVRSVRRSTEQRRRPIAILSDSPPIASEPSGNESELSETELKKARKKMKGILPASWVRMDREAQARRDALASQRLNVTLSPERLEHQRGIARRVTKRRASPPPRTGFNSHSNDVVVISDESDNELERPTGHTLDVQRSAQSAADLAAAFDHRYADNDSDNMENDRLQLFTLGGSSRKRKKQTKLTDVFTKAKKYGTSGVGTRARGTSYSYVSGRKKHSNSRRIRRTSPPALSVLDFDQSPSGNQHVPQFLKIAKRQARQRPDFARERPTNKHIRLHTADDTEDANTTLRQWRSGVLIPKTNSGQSSKRSEERGPLTDIDHNTQRSQYPTDAEKGPGAKFQVHPRRGHDAPGMRQRHQLPLGLLAFRRSAVPLREPRAQESTPASSTSRQRHDIQRKLQPFRAAQLEGLEADYSRGDRRMAFQQGLQEVDQQFNLKPSITWPSRNPQLARFLADTDTVLPPLPSANDIGDQENRSLAGKSPIPRRRLMRKVQAQRIDVDTRAYRQPSEPALADLFNQLPPAQDTYSVQGGAQESMALRGLGPCGTRYPTNFDVSPLKSDTYFHSSTFIGGMELHRALLSCGALARDMDEAAGYFTISHGANTLRCGPWNDETFSLITELMTNIWHPLDDQTLSESDRAKLMAIIFKDSSKLLRSLIAYFSTRLSFLDPIDRQVFATKMKQFGESLFTRVLTSNIMSPERSTIPIVQLDFIRTMTYLLVITMQIRQIAQHSVVEPCVAQELANMMKSISKLIVSQVLHHVSQLSNFLERNKKFMERENGIQNSEILVESLVVCMHVLAAAYIPGITFWELVSQELAPQAERATDLQTFESLWGILFTLLPFIEIDDSGIIDNRKRTSFQHDHWVFIRDLLKRLFALYPQTYRLHSSSLNDYIRATLTRCHHLIQFWHWNQCDHMLNVVFDFFATNGLKNLRREKSGGSAQFLEDLANKPSFNVTPNDNSFHIYLKCLALGLQRMKNVYHEKKIRSIVFRLTPNHGRNYPKDQPMETESLDALRNHHDLLCTLYYASPPSCRPKLDILRDLVHHETSHREASRLSVRAWASLTAFQLSTHEPYASARPLSAWHKEINMQTLKQYHLAKTEAEIFLKSGELDKTDASSLMVRQAMEKNQEQVIATLRDCIAGMQRAIESAANQASLREFLLDSGFVELLKLPHFEDARLVAVIRDILGVLRKYAIMPHHKPSPGTNQQPADESQDLYGGESLDAELLYALEQQQPDVEQKHPPLDFIQVPLWNLLSNAFGAGKAPDDNLLMDCVDTWALVASHQVSSGARSWSYYINPHGSVSWQQLSQTEQTQKFGPYFMAAFLNSDSCAYTDHRFEFFNTLLLSLADREAMLRFQYRLLHALFRVASKDPLMTNLPFFKDDQTGEFDITADTLRARRLALISSILANIREDFNRKIHEEAGIVTELRENYSVMLRGFMTAMKSNYQQLRQETMVTGAYVEFVQKVVQFLQQYTADICPILDFFTNSAAFPLPATDPTYVVGRLCGYAPKLARSGIPKQLSVFVQTVAQQAAASNQQPYLVNQLETALCTDESPTKDKTALRSVLLQGIFPTYIEAAFSSVIGFVIAKPILQSLKPILQAALFDVHVFDESNVRVVYDTIMSISHAFIRSTEQLKSDALLVRQSYVLHAAALMLDAMLPILSLLDYIYGRCSTWMTKPAMITYLEHFTVFIAELLDDSVPQDIPFYDGDAHAPHCPHIGLSSFCTDGLVTSIKTHWSSDGRRIVFGQGHAKRDVVVDLREMEEEKARLLKAIRVFNAAVIVVYGDRQSDGGNGRGRCFTGDVDV